MKKNLRIIPVITVIIILAIFLFNLEIGTKQRDSLRNSVYISLNTPLEPIPDTQNSTAELPDFVKGIDFRNPRYHFGIFLLWILTSAPNPLLS